MNIPLEVARAQGAHGFKGASHGVKGGRPRLALTDDERLQRRREQQEAYRRRNGIMPREVLTRQERRQRQRSRRESEWAEQYRKVWRKLPGEPLSPAEFASGQKRFASWLQVRRDCGEPFPQNPVRFVRDHLREESKRRRSALVDEAPAEFVSKRVSHEAPPALGLNDPCPCGSRRKAWTCCYKLASSDGSPVLTGRNDPCPCGSGRKFKKCCAR